MAWVALIPWFGVWVDHPQLSLKRTLRVALAGGLAFWVPAIQWVRLSDPSAWPGWLIMSLVLALWWPIMAVCVSRLHLRNHWPLWMVWPVVWGFQEIAREYYLTGFPWYHLSHTQFRQTWLIQISDLGGASLLSVLMVSIQALVFLPRQTLGLDRCSKVLAHRRQINCRKPCSDNHLRPVSHPHSPIRARPDGRPPAIRRAPISQAKS